jgi:hypothetical protein
MIQQHAHTFLHVDDSRSTLHRIATHSSRLPPILTPLQQYHSVFGLVGSIEDALAKPNITERCMACKAIQVDHVPGQRDTKWTNEKAPIVCQHCGSVNEISTQKSECWLHFAQVRVKVDDLDNAGALFQLQLETTELMELFASVTDEKKTKAFRDRAALNKSVARAKHAASVYLINLSLDLRFLFCSELRGRRLNLTCTLASGSFRPSSVTLRVETL